MPSRPPLHHPLTIKENGLLARRWATELSIETFREDRRTFYAVTRCLEIISEASRRLDPAVQGRHPHLPWRGIMAVGNIYRHEYDNVVEDFVWRTVVRDLPPLLAAIEGEIALLLSPAPDRSAP